MEFSILIVCGAGSQGDWYPKFRDSVLVLFSRIVEHFDP